MGNETRRTQSPAAAPAENVLARAAQARANIAEQYRAGGIARAAGGALISEPGAVLAQGLSDLVTKPSNAVRDTALEFFTGARGSTDGPVMGTNRPQAAAAASNRAKPGEADFLVAGGRGTTLANVWARDDAVAEAMAAGRAAQQEITPQQMLADRVKDMLSKPLTVRQMTAVGGLISPETAKPQTNKDKATGNAIEVAQASFAADIAKANKIADPDAQALATQNAYDKYFRQSVLSSGGNPDNLTLADYQNQGE